MGLPAARSCSPVWCLHSGNPPGCNGSVRGSLPLPPFERQLLKQTCALCGGAGSWSVQGLGGPALTGPAFGQRPPEVTTSPPCAVAAGGERAGRSSQNQLVPFL